MSSSANSCVLSSKKAVKHCCCHTSANFTVLATFCVSHSPLHICNIFTHASLAEIKAIKTLAQSRWLAEVCRILSRAAAEVHTLQKHQQETTQLHWKTGNTLVHSLVPLPIPVCGKCVKFVYKSSLQPYMYDDLTSLAAAAVVGADCSV